MCRPSTTWSGSPASRTTSEPQSSPECWAGGRSIAHFGAALFCGGIPFAGAPNLTPSTMVAICATSDVPRLLPRMVELLPRCLATHEEALRERGVLMPGAVSALKAVHEQTHCVPTVVTGNLRPNALLKLEVFGLDAFLDTEIGGYSSDDEHRPALVAVAQERAQAKFRAAFTRSNTVIIGDSLEDVRTGVEGGASVIGIASGKTTARELAAAGADAVLDSLEDVPRLMEEITTLTRSTMK
jgi:phosphoglycolate phosphatase-like HAD superfamily hydrolase